MRKLVLCIVCLAAMMAGTGLKAQEISITLVPGWNWISYTNAVPMEVGEALGDFTPVQGDIIKSKNNGTTTYNGTMWRGNLTHFMPGQGYKYFSSRTETTNFIFALAPSSFVTTAEPTDITTESAVVGGTVTIEEGNHVYARGVCYGTVQMPTVDDNHISNGIEIGSFTDTLIGLTSNTIYFVRAYVVTDFGLAYGEEQSFTTLNGANSGNHAYVDLGLPSGTLWATCNVGAETPEEYGDYFAWGETQPKSTYNWSTYQYSNGGTYDGLGDFLPGDFHPYLTKYCNNSIYGYNGFSDDLTILLPEDDAATANWGSDWRMPTREEWQELYNNTTATWTTQGGIYGWLFTASNGYSLFLPAVGHRIDSSLINAGVIGYYWSSSLNTYDLENGWELSFDSGGYYIDYDNRFYGHSVRPVRSAPQNNAPTGAINGKFTINANGDQVYFSQGNLQYQASTNTWRFAENQWDYVGTQTPDFNGNAGGTVNGSDNRNISQFYDGWIDLFGWGTSGFNHGAVCYQPWSSINTIVYYYAYGSYTYNLYDQTGQADWGYNVISNGGNFASWRTLTQPEWDYLFNTRNTISGIRYVKANVNGVNGVILLPDDWSNNVYYLSTGSGFSINVLTISQWTIIESAGAVFLPAAGYRSATSVSNVGSFGYYWSATYYDSDNAFDVYIDSSSLYANDILGRRFYGQSVRLVRSVPQN